MFGKVAAARAKAQQLAAASTASAPKPVAKASRGKSLKAAVANIAAKNRNGGSKTTGCGDAPLVELFSKQFVADVVARSARAQEQVAQLDELWPGIIHDLVQATVENLHRGDEWMSTLDRH